MPAGRGQMSGGGIPVCHKMIRGRCSEVHCLRCPDSDVSRGSKCPDIIIIRDVNSREIAFLGWEMQFPGLDRDSRFRPSTFTGDGVIGLGSPVGVQRGEGEGWSGADRRSPLPLPRAPPAIWLRSLWSPMPGPMARNVAKRPEERTREAQWPISPQKTGRVIAPHPVGCRWTIGWRHGRMDTWNGEQRPSLWRRGAPVETQAGNATGGNDRRPAPRSGKTTGIGRHCGWSAHFMSALTRLRTVIFPVSYIEAD